jgi:glutamate---cysteine ligase / carboxylate-amine ligase
MYQRALINENKWRASRYGLEGSLIDFGKETEVPTVQLIHELLDFVDDVVDELGSRHAIEYVLTMLEDGTGADRQLKAFEESGSMLGVVDYIESQFLSL